MRRIFVRCAFCIVLLTVVVVPTFEILVVQPTYLQFLIKKTEQYAAGYARDLAEDISFDHHAMADILKTPAFMAGLQKLEQMGNLLKLRVFAPDGEIIFSTMKNEIGERNTKAYFHEEVAAGRIYSKAVFEDEFSAEGQSVPVTLVEVYYPVMQGSRFIGAFELYYDISRDVAAIRAVNRSSSINLIGVCVLLGAVMLGGLYLVRQNVEQRIAAEERVRQLAAADQIDQQKNEFIAMIAHELQTPLTAIIGYAELLEELGDIDLKAPQRQEYLGYIRERGEALARLVSDLLDASQIDSGQSLAIDFHLLRLDRLLRLYLGQFRLPDKQFELEVELPENPVQVRADEGRIIQVLDNLLSNAIKYSPRGGTIRVILASEDGLCRVTVADEGSGMTPEQLDNIFCRFYRTEEARRTSRGIGLGLSIVKHIVEAHGGTLTAVSEPECGTSVSFTLPAVES